MAGINWMSGGALALLVAMSPVGAQQVVELTGEDRYNLYHHLAKLQEAGLVDYELEDSRAKKYFLNSDEDLVERFFYLEPGDSKSRRAISELLMVLADSSEGTLPSTADVESVSVIFRLRRK